MDTTGSHRSSRVSWRTIVALAAVSVITMPLTAIWFLLAGLLGLIVAGTAAMLPSERPPSDVIGVGASAALGLLVGPTVYLGLAVFT